MSRSELTSARMYLQSLKCSGSISWRVVSRRAIQALGISVAVPNCLNVTPAALEWSEIAAQRLPGSDSGPSLSSLPGEQAFFFADSWCGAVRCAVMKQFFSLH